MNTTLKLRQEKYENDYNTKIQDQLPIAIRVTLRNYKRLTQNLKKPYCSHFYEVIANAMLYTIHDISDAIFGYYYFNEIVFILRNDRGYNYEPWLRNNIQEIVSTVSSKITSGFYRAKELFNSQLELIGEIIFSAKILSLPSIVEVVNYLVYHQQNCLKKSISTASSYELTNKFGHKMSSKLLSYTNFEEKQELLLQHCDINFFKHYPKSFITGIGTYKVPTIISTQKGEITKNKWTLNYNIPLFIKDKDFLSNILTNGIDIVRAQNILND